MAPVGPGTYRITNAKSGTALTVSDDDSGSVSCWQRHDEATQKWFLQHSGGGWRIKNCQSGQYLTVSHTNEYSTVYCGRYPISWELMEGPQGHNVYIIKFAGCDRLFDLDKCGEGDKVTIFRQWEPAPHQRWKFERLSDDTGDEDQRPFREIAGGGQLASKLAIQIQKMDQVNSSLQSTQAQLAEVAERLGFKEQESNRLRRNDLGPSSEPSGGHALQDALSQANDKIRDRDIELLKLQNQMLREKMENESSKQQRETGELREKVAKLQDLTAQLSQGIVKSNNMA